MKKQYTTPSVETVNIFAEDAVMLRVSNGTTHEIWSNEKNNDCLTDEDWSKSNIWGEEE